MATAVRTQAPVQDAQQGQDTPSSVSTVGRKLLLSLPSLLVLALFYFTAPPEGLEVPAWRVAGLFVATILGILFQPLPSGAVMMVAIAFSVITGTLTEAQALAGFTNGTVWLIFAAYVISIGFLATGFGRRIAYLLVSRIGGSTLGLAYALNITDLIFAPAMPSATARSGGVVFPIVRSVASALGSEPGPTAKKLGKFLMINSFLICTVTSGMFLTSMAANPLAANLAKQTSNVEISWAGWAMAAIVPGLVSFFVLPLILFRMTNPEIKKTEGARELGRKALADMGPMTQKEWLLAGVFVLALLGWGTGQQTGIGATTIALAGVGLLFLTGVVSWKQVLKESAAWDTLIWFGAIVGLATALSTLGFIKWMTPILASQFEGWNWVAAFIGICLVYVYVHYLFATATGHVAALYAAFLATAVATGAPPMMAAITLGILSNTMWGLTEYGGGPGPIYFGQGYFGRPEFYKLNFVGVTFNLVVVMGLGMVWWKLIGLW